MPYRYTFCSIVIVTGLAVLAGCTKKGARVEPAPAGTAAPAPEAPAAGEQEDVQFETAEMDAAARKVLVPVYFEYDKYSLTDEAVEKLVAIAGYLGSNTGIRLVIEGHADEHGTDEYNLSLSENRSRSVRDYLTGYGIAGSRLEMVSYGKTRPAYPDCTDEPCHRLNRRVEWKTLAR